MAYPVVSTMRLEDDTCFFVDKTDRTKAGKFECEAIQSGTSRIFRLPDADITLNKCSDLQLGDSQVDLKTSSGDIYIQNTSTTGDIYLSTGTSGIVQIRSGSLSSGTDISGTQSFLISATLDTTINNSFTIGEASTAYYEANITCYNQNNIFSRKIQGQAYRTGQDDIVKTLDTYQTYGTIGSADISISVSGSNTITLTLTPSSATSHEWKGTINFLTNSEEFVRIS